MRIAATMIPSTMRAILIAIAGGAAALGALSVSWFDNGPIGAAAFLLALFLATVTAGVALAVATETLAARPRKSKPGNCGVCRSAMHQLAAIWVCPECDLTPAAH